MVKHLLQNISQTQSAVCQIKRNKILDILVAGNILPMVSRKSLFNKILSDSRFLLGQLLSPLSVLITLTVDVAHSFEKHLHFTILDGIALRQTAVSKVVLCW